MLAATTEVISHAKLMDHWKTELPSPFLHKDLTRYKYSSPCKIVQRPSSRTPTTIVFAKAHHRQIPSIRKFEIAMQSHYSVRCFRFVKCESFQRLWGETNYRSLWKIVIGYETHHFVLCSGFCPHKEHAFKAFRIVSSCSFSFSGFFLLYEKSPVCIYSENISLFQQNGC